MSSLPPDFEWAPSLTLGEETNRLTQLTWPRFLIEPSDHPEPGLRFEIDRAELQRRLPVWGLRHRDGRLAANASGVLLRLDPAASSYPDAGWRYAMEHFAKAEAPNTLCLLAANVHPDFRGHELARHLLLQGKELCRHHGLETMVGPVRPLLRASYPSLSFEEYCRKRNEHGLPFDPWIRAHTHLGAEELNIAHESVRVRASLERWRQWTSLPLLTAGEHWIPGGLAPLAVSLEDNLGSYVEPAIWVRHRIR